MEVDRCLYAEEHQHDEQRSEDDELRRRLTPIAPVSGLAIRSTSEGGHPRLIVFALDWTLFVMMTPTAIANAISAAARTTVVALTSPRSRSASADAWKRMTK